MTVNTAKPTLDVKVVEEEGSWATLYWEKEIPNKPARYYKAEITEDLFDIIVLCQWGTVGTSRGGSKSYPVQDIEHAYQRLKEIKKRRKQRGYIVITATV